MNKNAFTYIETLISITVFAIIVSIFVLSYKNFTNYSERSEVKNVVQIIKKARVTAIMQSSDVTLSLDSDEITVSSSSDLKRIYKLNHVKMLGSQSYEFTGQGGTRTINNQYSFYLESNKTHKKYKIIIAAVGGQVRYEEE